MFKIFFSIKFYKLNDTGSRYLYNLSTLPATSQILYGVNINNEDLEEEQEYLATLKDDIYQKIQDIKDFDLYWEES